MADSINNRSKNKEVADQFSVWITRRQGNQTKAIAPPLSPSRWTCAKTNAADTGITPSYSLRHRRNLNFVSKVCKAAPISLFWVTNGLNESPVVRFKSPFILIDKSTMAFLKGQSTRISALFRRRTFTMRPSTRRCPSFSSGSAEMIRKYSVSYTHLTLPTIYSV